MTEQGECPTKKLAQGLEDTDLLKFDEELLSEDRWMLEKFGCRYEVKFILDDGS